MSASVAAFWVWDGEPGLAVSPIVLPAPTGATSAR